MIECFRAQKGPVAVAMWIQALGISRLGKHVYHDSYINRLPITTIFPLIILIKMGGGFREAASII